MSNFKDGSVTLWKQDVRENPKRPVLRGRATIDGHDYEISLWVATDRETHEPRLDNDGNKFFTGKIGEPFKAQEPKPRRQPTPQSDDLF